MSYEITFMLSNAEEFSFGGSLPQSKLINRMRELEMVQMPKNRLAAVLKMGKFWQIDCQQSRKEVATVPGKDRNKTKQRKKLIVVTI